MTAALHTDLAEEFAAIEAGERIPSFPERPHRLYTPLVEAADEYERWLEHPEQRVYTGIPALDDAIRGMAPGEIAMLIGYNHSGKTLVATEMFIHNHDRRVVLFSPDETRVLVAVKLTAAWTGVSAEAIEDRYKNGDESVKTLVRRTIEKCFPTLGVSEDRLNLHQMSRYLEEAAGAWGGRPELVVYDYLELAPWAETPGAQMAALKAWGKQEQVPVLVLHQTSRTAGADGKPLTIGSGAYGGEALATFVIGVRRKKSEYIAKLQAVREATVAPSTRPDKRAELEDLEQELLWELNQHENTITVNLVKNKRPPSRLVAEIDFTLDGDTGRIRQNPRSYESEDF